MEQQSDNSEMREGSKTLWIIGGIILAIMIVGLVYGATQSALKKANSQADTAKPLELNNTPGASVPAPVADNGSVLGASDMVPMPVAIKGLQVVNLETLPQQVQAHISYSLAGDCATADTPTAVRSGSAFTVSLTSHAPKDATCSHGAVPGDVIVTIPVEGLAAGKYIVKVGTVSRSFVLKADNEVSPPISK